MCCHFICHRIHVSRLITSQLFREDLIVSSLIISCLILALRGVAWLGMACLGLQEDDGKIFKHDELDEKEHFIFDAPPPEPGGVRKVLCVPWLLRCVACAAVGCRVLLFPRCSALYCRTLCFVEC